MTSQRTPESFLRHLLTATTTVLVLMGAGLLVKYFYSLVVLLGMVLVITYILLGPVNLMERGISAFSKGVSSLPLYRGLMRTTPEANPRMLAVLIVYFAFFMTLTLGAIQFLPVLSDQLGELGQNLGGQIMVASDKAVDWADRNLGKGVFRNIFAQDIKNAEKQGLVKEHAAAGNAITAEEKQVIQQTVLQTTINQLAGALASAVPNFISLVGGTVNGFVYFLAGLLLTFYFLIDGHRVKEELLSILPDETRETTTYLLDSFHTVMFSFVKGQVMLGLLTGVYMFIVYSLFGINYAALLGVIFAIAELLPVVGTWIGISIGLSYILISTHQPLVALGVWACSYGYQTIKDNILAPKVVGEVMGLHPMVVLLSLFIGSQVAGLLGVLLAMPFASALYVVLRLLLKKDAQQKAAAIAEGGARG